MPNVRQLIQYKAQGRKIAVLTAWDYPIASILDEAGVDIILVGDSLAMVALGYEHTLPLSLAAIIHHAQAVKRGVKKALVVVDLPFLTYQVSIDRAIANAGEVLQQTGAQAVKVEGGYSEMVETIRRMVLVGIPVMGHIGLTPQSVHQLGYRQQGQTDTERDRMLQEAREIERAGAFAIVLEHLPADLAAMISQSLKIPTIGIGAGTECDGQVLVTADLLGLTAKQPPFAPARIDLRSIITSTVSEYIDGVRGHNLSV